MDYGRRPTRAQKMAARKASAARIAEVHQITLAIVETGVCPLCGSKLKQNLSITGWWQCEQFGSDGFRARNDAPQCAWQGFTQ